MVNFCSVENCLNSSRNRPDLSFFCFPSEGHFRMLWKNFCRRSDPEFQNKKNTRICSAHFEASSIKKSLCGRKEVIPGELPKYFNPSTHQCRVSSREKRLEDRKRRAVKKRTEEVSLEYFFYYRVKLNCSKIKVVSTNFQTCLHSRGGSRKFRESWCEAVVCHFHPSNNLV